jgi:uncharacterized protein (TIGR02246 family)
MRPTRCAVVLLTLVTLAACTHAPAPPAALDTSADEAAIAATGKSWFEAFNAGNVDGVLSTYADDAVVMPPGSPALTSREALRAFFTSETAGAKSAGIQIVDGESRAGVSGDLGWHQGSYTVKAANGDTVDAGSYMELWRKSGGKWLISRDIWNSSNKPAAPAASPAPAS